jgi:hypothetical protein
MFELAAFEPAMFERAACEGLPGDHLSILTGFCVEPTVLD